MTSANNIAFFRERRGWSRPELGRRMNPKTSGQQIERLEKGQRKLSQEWIDRAAKALEVMPALIITPLDEIEGEDPLHSVQPEIGSTVRVDQGEMVHIKQLDLSFSMGPGTDIDSYVEEMPVSFDLGYLRMFTRTPPARLRLAHGVGESMYPTLLTNDLVWIDTTQTQLNQQDRLWAISLFGAAAIKRLRAIGEDRVLVISDNPAVADQEVSADDLFITGRVIRIARDL